MSESYAKPWSLGPFRRSLARPVRAGKVGVGILVFNALDDLKHGLPSVLAHGKPEYEYLVFDNGCDAETPAWLAAQYAQVPHVRSFRNTGCWNARNRMLEHFAARGCEFVLFQDQDVRWRGDAAAVMRATFARYPDTGCVTWKLATGTMGKHRYDATGAVAPPESPGMCCMFSVPALLAGTDPGLIAWHDGYGLCFRGDSDVCFSLWSKGYKTRIVLGPCLIEHEHPHRGIASLGGRVLAEQTFSERVFQARRRKYGWPSL